MEIINFLKYFYILSEYDVTENILFNNLLHIHLFVTFNDCIKNTWKSGG
jgi:hypothetical protein